MKAFFDAQQLASRNNENEAVWRCFEKKRARRRLLGPLPNFLETILDDLDWWESEQECRPVRAVGFSYPSHDTNEAKETN